jgi:hypothetical protein
LLAGIFAIDSYQKGYEDGERRNKKWMIINLK